MTLEPSLGNYTRGCLVAGAASGIEDSPARRRARIDSGRNCADKVGVNP